MRSAVGIPVFNEEASLADLLTFLETETGFDEIVAVDDCSTDRSFEMLRASEGSSEKLRAYRAPERSGQLAAWRLAAEASTADAICFIDADAIPARGAIGLLFAALEGERALVAVSGRTLPDASSSAWPAARFRAQAIHRLRALQHARNTLIGRFFAVRRTWFLDTATRSDIIANDAYLGSAAQRAGLRSRYVPEAACYYGEARTSFDFAAQRQRADAGYAQLRELGVLVKADEPTALDYARVLGTAAARDPAGAAAWVREQLRARGLQAYRPSGRDAGAWEIQASTKRRLDPPLGGP